MTEVSRTPRKSRRRLEKCKKTLYSSSRRKRLSTISLLSRTPSFVKECVKWYELKKNVNTRNHKTPINENTMRGVPALPSIIKSGDRSPNRDLAHLFDPAFGITRNLGIEILVTITVQDTPAAAKIVIIGTTVLVTIGRSVLVIINVGDRDPDHFMIIAEDE